MDLIEKFDAAMSNVMNARKNLLAAKEATIEAKEDLKSSECDLIFRGQAGGKNEKEREAALRSQTYQERTALADAEKAERVAVLALEIALDARRNLESILKIQEIEKVI